jgi:nucleotide-binding universal stress UspA family protein
MNQRRYKKMRKAPIVGMAAMLLVGLVAAGAFAMPFGGNGWGRFGNEAVREALEGGDYDAYLSAIDEGWRTYRAGMTEGKFNEMFEHHQEMSEKRAQMQKKRAAVEAAIEAGDYEAWVSAIEGSPGAERLAEVITEDNFGTFAEIHQARQDKDWEKAKELAEELGIEGMHKGFGRGCFGKRMSVE